MHCEVTKPRFLRAAVAALISCALLLSSPVTLGADPGTDASEEMLTSKAEELLDQWRGQTELLHQAAEHLYLALKKNRNYAKAYMQVGRLHIMGGHFHSAHFEPSSLASAERAITKAIELDAKFADAYVLLGHLYTIMNRLAEAKSVLQTAESIGTASPWLAINWAIVHAREGKFDEAAARYRQVIASKTKNLKALGSAYDELRSYYVSKGDLAKAEETYQEHIVIEPRSAWTRGNYASNLLYDVGDFDRAIEKAREALSIMEYGNARETLALALYGKWATLLVKNRDEAGARKYFYEARSIYPSLPQLRMESMRYPSLRIIVEALNSIQR